MRSTSLAIVDEAVCLWDIAGEVYNLLPQPVEFKYALRSDYKYSNCEYMTFKLLDYPEFNAMINNINSYYDKKCDEYIKVRVLFLDKSFWIDSDVKERREVVTVRQDKQGVLYIKTAYLNKETKTNVIRVLTGRNPATISEDKLLGNIPVIEVAPETVPITLNMPTIIFNRLRAVSRHRRISLERLMFETLSKVQV